MNILTPEVRKQIATLQLKLEGGQLTYKNYLSEALGVLHKTLKNHLKEEYFFGKLYYRQQKDSLEKVQFYNDHNNQKNQVFHFGIIEAEKKLKEEKVKSLSLVIIDQFLRGLIMYKAKKKPQHIPHVKNYHFDEGIEKLLNRINKHHKIEDEYTIEPIIEIHKKMADDCTDDVYSYLIRTRTMGNSFNGSLFLALTRSLRVSEYSEIADLITFIMEANIIHEFKSKIYYKDPKVIAEEEAHIRQTDLGALNTLIGEMKAHRQNEIKFNHFSNTADAHIKTLSIINSFNLLLTRVSPKDDDEEDFPKQDKKIADALNIKENNLQSTLLATLNTIKNSLDVLRLEDDHKTAIRQNIIPLLEKNIKQLPKCYIKTIYEGLYIVFLELLKNAIYYSNSYDPKVEIVWKEFDENSYSLHFKNNSKMNKEDYEFLEEEVSKNNVSKRLKIGHRTIGRILSFHYFNSSSENWKKKVNESSKEQNETDIFLIIPKTDII